MQDAVRQKARKRPFLPPEFVRAMLAGHSALGIAFAALIYVVCISGTLAVFLHELYRWEQPDAPVVTQPLTPDAVAAAVSGAYEKALAAGAVHDIFVLGPNPVQKRVIVHFHDHESGVEGDWLADETGTLVAPSHTPWSEFVANLHMHLHLPRTWGLFLVGLTGVALLSSLISGLLSHPRLFKDAFALRRGGARRLEQADLHNRLGVWGLPFHVVVSTTGALLGLSTLVVGVLALAAYDGDSEKAFATILGPMASEDETAAPLPDVANMIRQVQARHPDAVFASVTIQHIAKAGQVVHVGMRTPGHLAMANTYYFDGTGRWLGDGGLETGSIGKQILGALQPLHFGWFGGFAVKIGYGLLGLAMTVVTATGITIWLARRRAAGRPAPRWENVWSGVMWGQPFAIAAVAVAVLLTDAASIAVSTYLVVTVVAIAGALALPDAFAAGRLLRAVSGVALLAMIGLHARAWGVQPADPVATAVNIAMGASAAMLIGSALVPWRRARMRVSANGL
ncbi:MAG TPA: PepSY-associated TM helix domain-containing protein [Hyphomicrobium sp.]|nr:PepSY-associated TM helix domain-containing protein [Hyphomicrobium sp.]